MGTGGVKLASRSHENLHVSVIDTRWLWGTNQVFYAPLLDFLRPGDFGYPHEYLLHGVVQGRWYKAVPYNVLESSPGFKFSSEWYFRSDEVECAPLTKEVVDVARITAKLFGETWILPVMLAIISCQKRENDLWRHGVDENDLQKVLDGIQGLRIPESWKRDKTITGHIISTRNYSDTRQLTRLMRALVRRSSRKSRNIPRDDEVSGDDESVYGESAVDDGEPEIEPEDPQVPDAATNEDESADADAQEGAKPIEEAILDKPEKSQRQDEVAKEGSKVKVKSEGLVSKWGGRKGKVSREPDRVEKDSDAKAAAKAIWKRRYGSGKLTKLKSAS